MIGWARIGNGEKWHQITSTRVAWDQPMARVACDPKAEYPYDAKEVMDFRWLPPFGKQCKRPGCQRKVDP